MFCLVRLLLTRLRTRLKAILLVPENEYVFAFLVQQLCKESVLIVRTIYRLLYFQDRLIIDDLVKPAQELLQLCLEIMQDGKSFLKKVLWLQLLKY